MTDVFHKFPHTPHLAWLGKGSARADKVLDTEEAGVVLSGVVTIEEKVDGANLGFANEKGKIAAWNRGTLLKAGSHPQFQPLWPWLAARAQHLAQCLAEHLIVYGEWCFAVHSIRYARLPDWFLGFDVYDRRAGRFWSADQRDEWLQSAGLCRVPVVGSGRYTLQQLIDMLGRAPSALTDGPVEGFYVRRDEGGWLAARAKLVRSEFVQNIDVHWSSRPLEKNLLQCRA